MSAILMGAAMSCGPNSRSLRPALVAIADNADDFGFACPSIATIAAKVCCDERTAIRLVQELERLRWVKVYRRVLGGKGSVYFIDIAKLGIEENPRMRRSQMHIEIAKQLASRPAKMAAKSGDKMSPEAKTELPDSHDKLSPEGLSVCPDSGDNPQGVQVTNLTDSGDKTAFAISKNHNEPLLTQTCPPTPLAGGERVEELDGDDAAFEAEQRGYLEARNRIEASEGRKPIAWDTWIADARQRRPKRVGPPPTCDAEFGQCESAEDAAELVMRRCGISAVRMRDVIAQALRLRMAHAGESACVAGYLAWRNLSSYTEQSGSMRYAWGPRKFFAEGHCWKPGSWPVQVTPLRL